MKRKKSILSFLFPLSFCLSPPIHLFLSLSHTHSLSHLFLSLPLSLSPPSLSITPMSIDQCCGDDASSSLLQLELEENKQRD